MDLGTELVFDVVDKAGHHHEPDRAAACQALSDGAQYATEADLAERIDLLIHEHHTLLMAGGGI